MIPTLGLYDFSVTESEKMVRLPLFYGLTENEMECGCKGIKLFYK
jgi:hypothetical protein